MATDNYTAEREKARESLDHQWDIVRNSTLSSPEHHRIMTALLMAIKDLNQDELNLVMLLADEIKRGRLCEPPRSREELMEHVRSKLIELRPELEISFKGIKQEQVSDPTNET